MPIIILGIIASNKAIVERFIREREEKERQEKKEAKKKK